MFKKPDIKLLQEILMNSWPAHHYYFLHGWILRFTRGVTSRANSVFPLHYIGNMNVVDGDIKFVEKAYTAYKLPAIFTLPEYFEPVNLDIKLLEHGYQKLGCTTYTMTASVRELINKTINEEFKYNLYTDRVNKVSNFLAHYSQRDQNAQNVLDALSNRIIIPQKRFIVVEYDNIIVGTLMGILEPRGFLYIVDVFVHPDFRRQKIATSMLFKIIKEGELLNEVKTIWLQVEIENNEAMNLYTKIGFKKAYSYYYLEKSLEQINK